MGNLSQFIGTVITIGICLIFALLIDDDNDKNGGCSSGTNIKYYN